MILVTGSSGVLGRPLVEALRSGNNEPVLPLTSADVDLRDQSATEDFLAQHRPRLVYHLAARVHGLGGNARFPAEMYRDNIRINTNLIDAAWRAGCEKIVAVSTVAAYSSDLPRPVRESAIWDGAPHGSERAYGHAKRAMLAQLEAYAAQFGLRFVYPIMTNIFGPDDRFDPENGHVIPSLVVKFHEAARTGGSVRIWGTGRAERDFLYGPDAAAALIAISEGEGPFNVATGATVPIRTVVEILSQHSGVTKIEWDASKPDGQLERSYDVSRLAETGFRPRISLRDGLIQTYDWYVRSAGAFRR
ncbi:NAD-dependent epimerase/dehydratase family protein [Sphingomonas sp.]|uniref:NAD-dependent epimerase/dehydratase family protein n=1 Tax=Sphingomonas sp. TaxID=28214 RepID=UPI000DAF8653|nr:NAD-dependent epimerase/dehydratase family protein [Sphingomonas sp.]PZU10313.1 MAG: GDP-fucose synthetase [Sphingomonas sp.]